jgi:zinc and cadmium transporter
MSVIALYTLGSVIVVSLISLVGIFTISLREDALRRSVFVLVSLAVGALFGDAFIHLIPEALEEATRPELVGLFVLLGIVVFFVFEKFLHWHHFGHHHDESAHRDDILETEKNRIKPLGYLVLTSDSVHNFIDGVIIAGSFLISIEVGIATTVAVILHEIPQEIGDYAILIHAGFSRMRALFMNFMTALFAILGALLTLLLGGVLESAIPYISAFAAGHFVYIAGADLIPELQKTTNLKNSMVQLLALIVGMALMFALLFIE